MSRVPSLEFAMAETARSIEELFLTSVRTPPLVTHGDTTVHPTLAGLPEHVLQAVPASSTSILCNERVLQRSP